MLAKSLEHIGSGEEIGPDPLMVDHDPMFHRETLAPDSDELADLKDQSIDRLARVETEVKNLKERR